MEEKSLLRVALFKVTQLGNWLSLHWRPHWALGAVVSLSLIAAIWVGLSPSTFKNSKRETCKASWPCGIVIRGNAHFCFFFLMRQGYYTLLLHSEIWKLFLQYSRRNKKNSCLNFPLNILADHSVCKLIAGSKRRPKIRSKYLMSSELHAHTQALRRHAITPYMSRVQCGWHSKFRLLRLWNKDDFILEILGLYCA